jgi:DNA polymerase III epsilon subunit-like protein
VIKVWASEVSARDHAHPQTIGTVVPKQNFNSQEMKRGYDEACGAAIVESVPVNESECPDMPQDHGVFFMVYDFETTSASAMRDRIISIGAVLFRYSFDGVLHRVSEFTTLVHTTHKISPGAIAIHGITPAHLENAPPLSLALTRWSEWVQKHVPDSRSNVFLMGHNINNFDNLMLYCNCVKDDIDLDTMMRSMRICASIDTLVLFRKVFNALPEEVKPRDRVTGKVSYRLGCCFEHFCDRPPDNAHDALADCNFIVDILSSEKASKYVRYATLVGAATKIDRVLWDVRARCGIAFSQHEQVQLRRSLGAPEQPPVQVAPAVSACAQTSHVCLACMSFFSTPRQCDSHRTVCESVTRTVIPA